MTTLFTPENKKNLISCNSCYLLGMLVKDAPYYPSSEDQKPVSTMKGSNNIVFYITPLSTQPEPIKELLDPIGSSDFYIGVDSHHYNNQTILSLAYKMTNDLEQKKEMLRQKFDDKLILFKPKVNFQTKENKELVYKNLEVVLIESDVDVTDSTRFIAIPKVNIGNSDFEKKLILGDAIILDDYAHVMPVPEYILCGDYLYYNFNKWSKNTTNNRVWNCIDGKDTVKRIKIDTNNRELKNKMIIGTENIVFIEHEFLNNSSQNGSQGEFIKELIVEKPTSESSVAEQTTVEDPDDDSITEYRFLQGVKEYTEKEGLCYSMEDIINFHVCVKTNPITILAGMSGTGKTQLALTYAKRLDLNDSDKTLLFLPISPSYTEPGDLLGYLNNTNGLFIPSETGLTDFLKHAEDHPDKMHMVIFDEMNLSQVEYWFAPFISLLERKKDDRVLQLYAPKSNCINNEKYPHSISIGSNIVFIGTVNMDETTKDFSDRLLDRANVVVLNKMDFSELQEEQNSVSNKKSMYEKYICSSFTLYCSWLNEKDSLTAYGDTELKFLDTLHRLIQKYDLQKGVSFRILKKMGSYLSNIPTDENGNSMLSKRDAFDIQIKQRLITKIKGIEKKYENLIGTIRDTSEVPSNSELYNYFNSEEAKGISDFVLTKKEICRKAKELGIYGYAN